MEQPPRTKFFSFSLNSYIGFTQGNRALTLVCSWDQMNGQLFHMTSIFGD